MEKIEEERKKKAQRHSLRSRAVLEEQKPIHIRAVCDPCGTNGQISIQSHLRRQN